jgi:hypothetical protein
MSIWIAGSFPKDYIKAHNLPINYIIITIWTVGTIFKQISNEDIFY